jgi:hypothetical protein
MNTATATLVYLLSHWRGCLHALLTVPHCIPPLHITAFACRHITFAFTDHLSQFALQSLHPVHHLIMSALTSIVAQQVATKPQLPLLSRSMSTTSVVNTPTYISQAQRSPPYFSQNLEEEKLTSMYSSTEAALHYPAAAEPQPQPPQRHHPYQQTLHTPPTPPMPALPAPHTMTPPAQGQQLPSLSSILDPNLTAHPTRTASDSPKLMYPSNGSFGSNGSALISPLTGPPSTLSMQTSIMASGRSSPSSPIHLHRCRWRHCTKTFTGPEQLYQHLCDDHVGRHARGNLCLECRWEDCQTVTNKRDHITSHLRVHVPLTPLRCDRFVSAPQRYTRANTEIFVVA